MFFKELNYIINKKGGKKMKKTFLDKEVVDKIDTCFYCETIGSHYHEIKTLFIPVLSTRRNKRIKKVCLGCIELKKLKKLIDYKEIVYLKNGFIEEI